MSSHDHDDRSKLAKHLDELRLVPRFIATSLAFTAVALTWRIVDALLLDGVAGAGELTALTAVLVAMITSSVTVVSMLGRHEKQ